MIICAANGAQAAPGGEQQNGNSQSFHSRFDDFDRWKQVVVLSAFVDGEQQTVTLRGLHFGKKTLTVFCETEKMKVLRSNDTEVVVHFPKTVKDGTYLFTVARGNSDHECGEFHVTKVSAVVEEARPNRRRGASRASGARRSRWTSGTGRRGWCRWTGWCGGSGRASRACGRTGAGWDAGGSRSAWSTGCSGSAGCAGACGDGWAGGSGREALAVTRWFLPPGYLGLSFRVSGEIGNCCWSPARPGKVPLSAGVTVLQLDALPMRRSSCRCTRQCPCP